MIIQQRGAPSTLKYLNVTGREGEGWAESTNEVDEK